MSTKKLATLLGIGAVICFIAALLAPMPSEGTIAGLISFPFAQIGGLLRRMSLENAVGNIVAVLLYGAMGLAPLLALLWRIVKRKAGFEDSLLVVISALLFFMIYLIVNPGLVIQHLEFMDFRLGKAILGGVFYSVLIGYLILRLLRRVNGSKASKMLDWLRLFLALAAGVMVFSVFYLGVANLVGTIQQVKSANTDPSISLAATNVLIVIRFILQQIPVVLSVWLLLLAIGLAGALKKEQFGRETVEAAGKLGAFCKLTLAITVLSAIVANLMQLLFSRSLLQSDFAVDIPLTSVILMLIVLVLAQYLDDSSKLNEDNQLII
jgi:hypothetical protein